MTNTISKQPKKDPAEENAYFPSDYSLSQFTRPVSDLSDAEYPQPHTGGKKILVIASDERYLPTDNGSLFSTGNHPVETLVPMYHLHAAGFDFDIATLSGRMAKFEYWAMPHEDEKLCRSSKSTSPHSVPLRNYQIFSVHWTVATTTLRYLFPAVTVR